MTIGKEIIKADERFHLLYNHQVIDLVGSIFDRGNKGSIWEMSHAEWKLIGNLWNQIIEHSQEEGKDLVFTFTWNFNEPAVMDYFTELTRKYDVMFVELEASVEERLRRNHLPDRLEAKECKRNIAESDKALLERMEYGRLNSFAGEIPFEQYVRIDTEKFSPEVAAKTILILSQKEKS